MAAMIPVLNMKVKDLPVLAAFCAPLVVTSAVPLPQLTAVGIAANLLITRMTTARTSCPVSAAAETKTLGANIKSLVITTDANRATRGVLGAVHMAAAVAMGARGSSVQDPSSGAGVFALWLMLHIVGVLVLMLAAAIWLFSGWYGQ